MNLALLPWEQLEAELRRVLALKKNPLACAADWHEVGKPMAAFLHSAELLNLAHQISDRESVPARSALHGECVHEPSSTISVFTCCARGPGAVRGVAALPRCLRGFN